MAIEAVIRHDAPQIRVAGEEDAKQIIHLALVPIGPVIQMRDGWDGGGFIRIGLDADATVVAHGEEVVDDFEAVGAGGVVDAGDVGDHGVFGRGVGFQEGDGRGHAGRGDVDGEFVLPDGELLDVFGEAGHEVLAVGVQAGGFGLVFVGGVYDWRVEFAAGWRREGHRVSCQGDVVGDQGGRQTYADVERGACWAALLGMLHLCFFLLNSSAVL